MKIFLFTILLYSWAFSQESTIQERDTNELKPRIGVFFHPGFSFHFADFTGLPNVPSCCPEYGNIISSAYEPGISLNYPIDYKWLINARASYGLVNASFESSQFINVLVDGVSTNGKSVFYLNTDLSLLNIDLNAMYTLDSKINFMAGPRLSFIMNSKYNQVEKLTEPSDRGVFYPEYTRSRNELSGDIDNLALMLIGFNIGASYRLPLTKNGSLFLVPEAFYHINFNRLISNVAWTMHSANIGLAVEFRQPPPPPPPPPPPINPPLPKLLKARENPLISADISVMQLDEFGKKQEKIGVKIEDFISFNMRPLLNYVFFDENSYAIPNRYNRFSPKQAQDFNLKSLQNLSALETYYYVLDIYGKRLQDNPDEKVTLIGTNQDFAEEKNNTDLSKKRAETIADYFNSVWNVSKDRISIQARNLPKQYSRSDTITGLEENRRVEIMVSNKLGGSILTVDTVRQINITTFRFIPDYKADAGLKSWKFTLKQGGKVLIEKEGGKDIPNFIDWSFKTGDDNAPVNSNDINYDLVIIDELGQRAKSNLKKIVVEQLTVDKKRLERRKDKEYEYYSLILFPYGGADLGEEHREVVDFVKGRLNSNVNQDNTEVKILGYSDSVGDEKINKRIATARAEAVYNRLNMKNAQYEGIGEDQLLYDNGLPEGRFYCRTVRIEVESTFGE